MRASEHARIQDLLGVYATDAVDRYEADDVARHLQSCAECEAEVAEHRETLAFLAPVNSSLRPRAFDELDMDLSSPLASVTPFRPRRTVPAWTMSVAAAMVFLISAVATLQTRRADDLSSKLARGSLAAAADRAFADPDTRDITLRAASGQPYARVALMEDGQGYFIPADMPELGPDQTYQLWALKGPERTSLAVAGAQPKAIAFRTTTDIDGLALTQEVAGGAPQPTKTPVAVAFLRES